MINRFFGTIAGSLALALTLPLAQPVSAKDYAVSKIKYKNKGAYQAFFNLGIKYQNGGGNVDCPGSNTKGNGIESGKSITLRLDNSDGSILDNDSNWRCSPNKGEEVWGIVYIDNGTDYSITATSHSCRKDGNKFYYHPDGGQLVVKSGGTTMNNNRCKLESKGGVLWDEAIHGSLKK